MTGLTKLTGCLLALSLVSISPATMAESNGDAGISVQCSEYVFYKVTSPGDDSMCVEDREHDKSVVCGDEKGTTAEANCSDGCKSTARAGTCQKLDLTPPPPPPPPATT